MCQSLITQPLDLHTTSNVSIAELPCLTILPQILGIRYTAPLATALGLVARRESTLTVSLVLYFSALSKCTNCSLTLLPTSHSHFQVIAVRNLFQVSQEPKKGRKFALYISRWSFGATKIMPTASMESILSILKASSASPTDSCSRILRREFRSSLQSQPQCCSRMQPGW